MTSAGWYGVVWILLRHYYNGFFFLFKQRIWFQSIPNPHEPRYEIQFTPICHIDIRPVECDTENDCNDEIFSLESVKVEEENIEDENSKFEENGNHETEQHPIQTNKSNSINCNINDVRKENLQNDSQPVIINKGNHPAKIMKKKILKQKSLNILTKKTSGASSKDILSKLISHSHKTQKNTDITAVRTQVEQTPVAQLTEIFNCDICEFKTSRKRNILAHYKAHVAKQMFCCNNCDYKC
ncbi:unnamed protein product, partial [Parnassius mnemosyne]